GYSVPEYLRTHPMTLTRISEAKERAEQLRRTGVAPTRATTTVTTEDGRRVERVEPVPPVQAPPPPGNGNPLLPSQLRIGGLDEALGYGESGQFRWAQERLRALSANTTDAAIREYEALRRARPERSEEHTSELQSRENLVCRLLL